MTTPVTELVTKRFLIQYGAPDTIDQKAFLAEYEKALAGTDADLLKQAADLIVKQHKYRNWPTVGECVAAVEVVATQRNREREMRAFGKGQREHYKTPTADDRARVAELVAVATQALTEASDSRVKFKDLPAVDKAAWAHRLATSPIAREFARRR